MIGNLAIQTSCKHVTKPCSRKPPHITKGNNFFHQLLWSDIGAVLDINQERSDCAFMQKALTA